MLKGCTVAIVTPMNPDGSINKASLLDLIDWHLAEKTQGIVVTGTTGESPTITSDEQFDLFKTVVAHVNKRIPVIAGTGSNSTQHTIEKTQLAKKAGVDACLIVTPYYNKPPQNGLYEHYKTIAENVSIPIVMYNAPGRTACDLLTDTVERLAKIPNIIGIKDCTNRIPEIQQRCPDSFYVVTGEDGSAMDLILKGANGVISVTANVAPRKMFDMCEAALSKNKNLAEKLNSELEPLHKKLFIEANPIPVKWVLNQMGKIPAGIRLPLIPLDAKYHKELLEAMQQAGIQQKVNESCTIKN